MKLFGGIEVSVDGEVKDPSESLVYKAFMLSGIPNLAFMFGYTNSSWTLKVGLVCDHLCRMLAYMDQHGYTTVMLVADDPGMQTRPMPRLSAGYILRAADGLRQGDSGPWTIEMDYWADHARCARVRSMTRHCASARWIAPQSDRARRADPGSSRRVRKYAGGDEISSASPSLMWEGGSRGTAGASAASRCGQLSSPGPRRSSTVGMAQVRHHGHGRTEAPATGAADLVFALQQVSCAELQKCTNVISARGRRSRLSGCGSPRRVVLVHDVNRSTVSAAVSWSPSRR